LGLHLTAPLAQFRRKLNITRRLIRLFRFLDAFHKSYSIVSLSSSQTLTTESYLDVTSNTFNGFYLLLETITIGDALQVDELSVWGPEYELVLKKESQRCWFFALLFGAVASGLRLSRTQTEIAALRQETSKLEEEEKSRDGKGESEELTNRKPKTAGLETSARAHLRKIVACVLDLSLPGSFLGWIQAGPLTVGLVMTITSGLTGFDVWERCGKDIAAK
jgi:hypothetical protein